MGGEEPADGRDQGGKRGREPGAAPDEAGHPRRRGERVSRRTRSERYGVVVNEEGAKVVPADEYKGMWNYAACEKLLADYPQTASAISIGPVGELQLKGASIACTDQEKQRHPAPSCGARWIGRGHGVEGFEVAGSRPGAGASPPAGGRHGVATRCVKEYSKAYLDGPQIFKYGTSAILPTANMLNTLPYKNRTEGQSPDAANLAGMKIVESFEVRGGAMHNCMTRPRNRPAASMSSISSCSRCVPNQPDG